MSGKDRKLLGIVNEDLTFLSTKWNQAIDDVSLRIASPILRRLLIDGMLTKAANMLNMQIEITVPLVSRAGSFENLRNVEFYQCGGAKYKGMIIQSVSMFNKALSPQEIKELYQRNKDKFDKTCPVNISVFLKQPSFVIRGTTINREEVIKYVANKLGGAHYDSKRKIAGDTSKITLEHKYALMDMVHNGMIVASKDAIYYELLSIGQTLINSRDVCQLRKKLGKLI